MTGPTNRSKTTLVLGSLAGLAAIIAVIGFVLPAEFGIDPTGIGKATGLIEMSAEPGSAEVERGRARGQVIFPLETQRDGENFPAVLAASMSANGVKAHSGTIKADRFTIELLPYEAIELKYEMAEGAPLAFSWKASEPVEYDMHAHPHEGGEKLTESYAKTDGNAQSGLYVAPFAGIHGWYWQNRTLDNVTLTLDAAGVIAASYTFDQAGQHDRALTPPVSEAADQPAQADRASS